MPLTRERAEEIFKQVLKYSTADETEAMMGSTSYSLTRFANNIIHQNVLEEGSYLSVRAVAGQRTARASTNRFDDASIRQIAEAALELARTQPPDPDMLPMPAPQTYRAVSRYYGETAELTPKARAETVKIAIGRAEKDQLTAAGIFSSGASAFGLFNSRGLAAFHEETLSEFSVTMLGTTSSGWAKQSSPLALELDAEGLAVHEKRSCLTDRLGQKIFGDNVEVRDDVFHPLQSGAAFDGEGMPRQRVTLVEKGVAKNLVYSRSSARKMAAEPTGHGFPLPNEYGEAPMNIVMEGNKSSVKEMVASTERGLLVTRLWYIREVDPYRKILTGMTRDGTFLIEEGKVRYGVRNLRFNQSVIEMLGQIEMLGAAERTSGEESFDMVVPPLKIRDFNFSSVTKF